MVNINSHEKQPNKIFPDIPRIADRNCHRSQLHEQQTKEGKAKPVRIQCRRV